MRNYYWPLDPYQILLLYIISAIILNYLIYYRYLLPILWENDEKKIYIYLVTIILWYTSNPNFLTIYLFFFFFVRSLANKDYEQNKIRNHNNRIQAIIIPIDTKQTYKTEFDQLKNNILLLVINKNIIIIIIELGRQFFYEKNKL